MPHSGVNVNLGTTLRNKRRDDTDFYPISSLSRQYVCLLNFHLSCSWWSRGDAAKKRMSRGCTRIPTPSTINICTKVYPPRPSESSSHDISSPPSKMSSSAKPPAPVAFPAQQQESDNIAHALAGAGGGLLSMTLTYVQVSTLDPPFPHLQCKQIYTATPSLPSPLEPKSNLNAQTPPPMTPPAES